MLQTITIPQHGDVSFTYTDSGPPRSSSNSYKTIVFLHGTTYHSGIYERLNADVSSPSSSLDLRLIAINRRGYNGSSEYTPEELEELQDPSYEKLKWLKNQGRLLVVAIAGLIDGLDLPEAGGVVLCGWSLGCTFTLAILEALNDPSFLPSDIREKIFKYLRSYILYDPGMRALGIPLPPGIIPYNPLADTTIHERARNMAWGIWIASYYTHSLPSTSTADLTDTMALFSGLETKEASEDPRPTNENFRYNDYMRLATVSPALFAAEKSSQPSIEEGVSWRHKFVSRSSPISPEFSRIKPYIIYGARSVWSCVYPALFVETEVRRERGEGEAESVSITRLEGANHFMMWDNPQGFLQAVATCAKQI